MRYPLYQRYIIVIVIGLAAISFLLYHNLKHCGKRSRSTAVVEAYQEFTNGHPADQPTNLWSVMQIPRIGTPHILYWTPRYSKELGLSPPFLGRCPHQCTISPDRSFNNHADAILFEAQQTQWNDVPKFRTPNQVYVFLSSEVPEFPSGHIPGGNNKISGFFNWTMSYRLDSDVPYATNIDGPIAFFKDGMNMFQLNEYDLEYYLNTKQKPAMWIASVCHTPSRREEYVAALQKHIDVTVFGKCLRGNKSCKRQRNWDRNSLTESWCVQRLKYDYYFYLSLENAICKDYVTEKLLRAVREITVPIVFERSVANRFLPNDAFIAVDDFTNASAMARYMKDVMRNKTLYKAYFKWRLSPYAPPQFTNVKFRGTNFCSLCQALHVKFERKNIHDPNKFLSEFNCSSPPETQFQ